MTTSETIAGVKRALAKNLPISRADVRSLVVTCETLLGIVSSQQTRIASLEAAIPKADRSDSEGNSMTTEEREVSHEQ